MDVLDVLSVWAVDRYRGGLDEFGFPILCLAITKATMTRYRVLTSHGKDRISWREP